jgi:hypothetical protein
MIGLSVGMSDDRVIQASQVETIIRAGEPAEFDDYTIEGDLNLSGLKINGPVHFNNTVFQNSVNFESTIFNGDAYLWYSDFKDEADFRYSDFKDDAYFVNSDFKGDTNFGYSAFNGTADFGGSDFNGTTYFVPSDFKGDADFMYTDFNGAVLFQGSDFNGTAYFMYSEFKDDAYFMYSDFKGDAYFDSSDFKGNADFRYSDFKGDAYFGEDTFDKGANFNEGVFRGNTSFNNSQLKGDGFFKNTTFQSKLSLTDATYNRLFLRWHKITRLVYDDAAYMSLMKNFKDLGYFEDYDSCYFQYRKEHRGQPWPGIAPFEASVRKFFDIFLEYFYGYGKKPLLPLAWSLVVMLVFGIFWGAIGQRKQEAALDEYNLTQNEIDKNLRDEISSIINPLLFSVIVFLSGTKLFIDPPDVPDNRSLTKVLFTLERVLGAFFSILFFLAISGTVVR